MSQVNNAAKFTALALPLELPYSVNNSPGSVTDAKLEAFLGLAPKTLDALVKGNATNGSAVAYSVAAKVGDQLVVSYDFQTNEAFQTSHYNDTAFLSVAAAGFTDTQVIADTFSTVFVGYQSYTYTFTQSGTFTLGLGVVNKTDIFVNSALQVAAIGLNGVALAAPGSIGLVSGAMTGTDGNDVLSGDALVKDSHDIIYGLAGNDVLSGLGGNDTLYGADGNDSLMGGLGNDVLDGGTGFDVAQYYTATAGVTVNLALTVSQNTAGAGWDTLRNIEKVNGSAYNDTLTGNAADNILLGGAGNDVLYGGDGNDSLMGGLGDDVLDGGAGSNVAQYYTATAGVTVNLALTVSQNTAGAGWDTLRNIEKVNGSAYNDTLTGNAADNILLGGAGNDVLDGGLGADVLVGGAGKDSFLFDTALNSANRDVITDFSTTDDAIQLDHHIFTGLNTGSLAATAFKVIGGSNVIDSNDHILYNIVSGGVFYDADGSGVAAAVLVALIGRGLNVSAADFTVV
ncbi:calcium-binding protein [Methylovulum psychrotolerans]|nr:calcium-binding protein [Methylovulum psychrotolerans]